MMFYKKNKIGLLTLCCIILFSTFKVETFAESELANTYYVSCDSGNDITGDGSFFKPWRTIQKAADNMDAGDTCLIRQGTYREQVVVKNSGAEGKPITFQAYGNENVVISGAEVLTGWQKYSGNIYVTSLMNWNLADKNSIYVNKNIMCLAKWPNSTNDNHLFYPDWAIMDSGNNYSIKDTDLNQPDGYWNGGKVVSPCGLSWILYSSDIVSYTKEGGLVLKQLGEASDYYRPKAGNKYYIYDCLNALDAEGEWYFDRTNKKLYLYAPGGADPSTLIVESKKRDYAFVIENTSYVHLRNLNIFAAGINTGGANHALIEGVNLKYTCDPIVLDGKFNYITKSHLSYSPATMIKMVGEDNIVFNNLLEYGNYVAKSWDALVYFRGRRDRLAYNTIRYAGRDCVQLGGKEGFIEFNDISYAGMLTCDNGLVYGGFADAVGTEIRYNWLHDNVAESIGDGLYPDSSSSNYVIHHNVIWNVNSALRLNTPSLNILVYNNTFIGKVSTAKILNTDMSGVRFANNIVTGTCKLDHIYYPTYTDKTGGFAVKYNNIYNDTDPLFTNTALFDYTLQPGSPGIDKGVEIEGITDDFFGTAPDIGAYEHGKENWIPGHDFENLSLSILKPQTDTPYKNKVLDGGFEIVSKSFESTRWEKTGSNNAEIIKAVNNTNDENSQQIERRTGNYGLKLGEFVPVSASKENIDNLEQKIDYANQAVNQGADITCIINATSDVINAKSIILNNINDIIPNYGFENTNETMRFYPESCSLEISPSHSKSGAYSLRVSNRQYSWSGPRINIKAGNKRTYLFSYWLKADPQSSLHLFLRPDGKTTDLFLKSVTVSNEQWVNVRQTYTFNEDYEFENCIVMLYGTPATGDLYLDDFQVIDITDLIEEINFAKSLVSSLQGEQYASLQNAISSCETVINNLNVNKEAVNQAIIDLDNAIISSGCGDITILSSLIDQADKFYDSCSCNIDGLRQQITGLKPNTRYKLSAWGKVLEPEDEIIMGLTGVAAESKKFKGLLWEKKEIFFKTGDDTSDIKIYFEKPSGVSKVYLDDVALTWAEYGPVGSISEPLQNSRENTPAENVFKITNCNKEFILLDITANNNAKFMILTKDFYGNKLFDANGCQKFDANNTGNIGYWLNNQFNDLPAEISSYINKNQEWFTEGGNLKGEYPVDYVAKAGISLMSYTEFIKYIGKFGIKDNIPSGTKGWWLRTGEGFNFDLSAVLYANISNVGTISEEKSTSELAVRPVFYLNKDFFKNVKIDLRNSGINVRKALTQNYSFYDLYEIYKNNYTFDEFLILLGKTGVSFTANQENTAGDIIVGTNIKILK